MCDVCGVVCVVCCASCNVCVVYGVMCDVVVNEETIVDCGPVYRNVVVCVVLVGGMQLLDSGGGWAECGFGTKVWKVFEDCFRSGQVLLGGVYGAKSVSKKVDNEGMIQVQVGFSCTEASKVSV